MSAITLAGERLMAQLASQGQPLEINKMVFAKIQDLDHTAGVDRTEVMPEQNQIKDILPITKASVINENTVVYSTVMGSDVGTYEFNWIGLWCEEHDTIVAIAYVPLQEKRATIGQVLGNILTKNFATEYNGAASITGINLSAESWQIDYTARLEAMDLNTRETNKTLWGEAVFYGQAFKVEKVGDSWQLAAGRALAKGVRIEIAESMAFVPDVLPCSVYLDVYQRATMSSLENKFKIITTAGDQPADYSEYGETHQIVKIAEIIDATTAQDAREIAPANFTLIGGCLAVIME